MHKNLAVSMCASMISRWHFSIARVPAFVAHRQALVVTACPCCKHWPAGLQYGWGRGGGRAVLAKPRCVFFCSRCSSFLICYLCGGFGSIEKVSEVPVLTSGVISPTTSPLLPTRTHPYHCLASLSATYLLPTYVRTPRRRSVCLSACLPASARHTINALPHQIEGTEVTRGPRRLKGLVRTRGHADGAGLLSHLTTSTTKQS